MTNGTSRDKDEVVLLTVRASVDCDDGNTDISAHGGAKSHPPVIHPSITWMRYMDWTVWISLCSIKRRQYRELHTDNLEGERACISLDRIAMETTVMTGTELLFDYSRDILLARSPNRQA